MTIQASFPAAHSSRLPEGVSIQPRRYEFQDLDRVPQYWFAGNPIISHLENAFSILIPPGERFFIQSVRNFQDRAEDPEVKELIRAFIQQEGLHTRAHNELNRSFAKFGVDVDREVAFGDRIFNWMARRLPRKVQLGVTVFLEHLTATGAHVLFMEPKIAEFMHPEMLRFWRWHAAEELEHKAVAFDLFRAVGGGYLLRVFSAIVAIVFGLLPFNRVFLRMMKDDPTEITAEMKKQARDVNKIVMGPQLRMIGRFFKPSFHPWQCDDQKYLKQWYESAQLS